MISKVACVYTITCKLNNKIYVGSTNNFHRRKLEHIQSLNRNAHENKFLQQDWNKYGAEEFEFCIKEELLNQDYLNKSVRFGRENYWIQELNTQDLDKGYNIADAYGSKPMSKEQKELVSKVHKGNIFLRPK